MQVGFLYLRYVCDPKNLWGWISRFADDEEVRNQGAEPLGPHAMLRKGCLQFHVKLPLSRAQPRLHTAMKLTWQGNGGRVPEPAASPSKSL
jgi:hypothetical protein